jgi:hypothetical protein
MMSEEKNSGRAESREAKAPQGAPQSLNTISGTEPALSLDAPGERHVRSPDRKPFGSMVQKLAVPPRPGYHRHWFNEEPGRIGQALENGYNHVLDNATKKPIARVVNKAGQQAYLMEIPQAWFDEDMAAQQQAVDDKEDTIRRGQVEATDPRDRDARFRNTAQGRKIDIRSSATRRSPG